MDMADGTTITGSFSTKLMRRTPECKAFINPYKEGEANGLMEVYYGDGGFYKGMMENGRVVGAGDYQSAMNEVISGNFLDGVLHGKKGFVQNQIEDVFVGDFLHGELHGKGTFQNKRGDSYDGYWQYGMRHGRGVSYYEKAGCFRGFYLNNLKHGKGSLEYGYSKSRFLDKLKEEKEEEEKLKAGSPKKKDGKDASKPSSSEHTNGTDKNNKANKDAKTADTKEKKTKAAEEDDPANRELSEFNNIYQGYFIGNGISNRGSRMNTKLQLPGIISRLDIRATYNIIKVLKREERLQKSAQRQIEKFNDIECHIREEIMKKKIKIYNQQKHFTKKTMYKADTTGLGHGAAAEFEAKLQVRKERLLNLTVDNHLFKKAVVPRLRIPNNTSNEMLRNAFGRIKPERGEVEEGDEVDENLLSVMLSDFEEVQERQRFLKYDRIWQRAEDAYVGNRSAAV